MGGLVPSVREVVLLRDVEGLTAPEVAEVLGIGLTAVKSRLHRGRLALRETPAPFFEEHVGSPLPSCPDVLGVFSRTLRVRRHRAIAPRSNAIWRDAAIAVAPARRCAALSPCADQQPQHERSLRQYSTPLRPPSRRSWRSIQFMLYMLKATPLPCDSLIRRWRRWPACGIRGSRNLGRVPNRGHQLFEGYESDRTVLSAADTAPAMEADCDKAARDIADTPTP